MHSFGDDDEDDFDDLDDEKSAFDVEDDADEIDAIEGVEELDDDDLPDNDDEEEAETELLASGAQRCPLCGKHGSPDDLDSCEHFHAVVWDDEVILGGDDLNPAWEELQELWAEYDEVFLDQYVEELEEKLSRAPVGIQRVVREGLMDENPLFWIDDAETVDLEHAAGGGTTGSGYAVYHRRADFMERLVNDIQRTRAWLEKFAKARLEDDDL